MPEEMKLCPFCGESIGVQVCDDEGNLHDQEYENDPWSGLKFKLVHGAGDGDCPIATDDGESIGVFIYDTREEAVAAWNRRAPEPGTSVIRWTRYDGTPETAAESHRTVLFIDDDEVRCGRVMDDDRGMRLQVGKLLRLVFECGDLWAYLPEPPEGMG